MPPILVPPVGPVELIIVLVIVFVIFGAGKLTEIGGALGKGIREFRTSVKEEEEEEEEESEPQES